MQQRDKVWVSPQDMLPAQDCDVHIITMSGCILTVPYCSELKKFNVRFVDDADSKISTESIFAWCYTDSLLDQITRDVGQDFNKAQRKYYGLLE